MISVTCGARLLSRTSDQRLRSRGEAKLDFADFIQFLYVLNGEIGTKYDRAKHLYRQGSKTEV